MTKFVTTSIEELYGNGREPFVSLYVYSIPNNPDGAGEGTDAKLIGTAYTYTYAYDLWDAACATADAIGVGQGEIGLCIVEGALLAAQDEHDGQPDEAQEWADFDPDC